MNLIQVQNGAKAFGARALFADATFAINTDEHVGVIGPNGAGKTTLFKILTEEEELDSGTVIRSRGLRVGYLKQEVTWRDDETLETYLDGLVKPIWELKALALGLGMDEARFHIPLNSMSGGYRMRAKLLHLLGTDPNLMLLDEPTNYLDLESLLVLERFLQNFRGTFMLISHDREFLRRTTDHTLEVEGGEITKYPGNIDDYFEEKALIREQMERQAASETAKKQIILDFAARFGAKATKARQVQSRLKRLEKMESIEVKALPVSARINIPEPTRIGKKAISLQNVDLGYPGKRVLSDINLTLVRGDKVGIVGVNGVGKSTLLKSIAGALKPQKGTVEMGMDVRIGYYAQHVAEELHPEATVLDELQKSAHREVSRQQILDLAGSLLFSGDRLSLKINRASGGEKARVALGKILLARVPLLVLDEVTNHLDFNTVEALTQALERYQGTLVIVSHDRGFIRRIAKKIYEIRDGRVREFPGTYEEYVWSQERGTWAAESEGQSPEARPSAATQAPIPVTTNSSGPKLSAGEFRERQKELERSVRECEKRSKDCEARIATLQARLTELTDWVGKASDVAPDERATRLKEMHNLPYDIVAAEERWMAALEEKERHARELAALSGKK